MRVTRFERRRGSGFSTSMYVVGVGGDDLLLYSPTFIDEACFGQIEALGRPRWLLAPNHYHHLSLARYRARFPDAAPIASAQAIPRLTKQGHTGLRAVDDVELPRGARLLVPPHTKSGETWLALDSDEGTSWLVCDAFFNEPELTGVEGFALRALKIGPGLCVGATFTGLVVADRVGYRDAALALIAAERPSTVHFSHGAPLREGVTEKLSAIVRQRLGQ